MANPNGQVNPAAVSGMSHEQLLEIVKAIRQPVKTEKEIREEEQLKADAKQMGEILVEANRNKQKAIKDCSHMRPNGSTTAVWTGDPINKLYCQVCGGWIGPDQPELFNRLYQLAI